MAERTLARPAAGAVIGVPVPTAALPQAEREPPADVAQSMQTMHALLRGQTSAEEAADVLGAPLVRLRAYQRFVRAHVQDVLDKNYPTLRAVLGEARWLPLCAAYFAQVPADDAELNAAARQLPAFLEAQLLAGAAGLTSFHAELALVEWEEFAAYINPARIPDAGELQSFALNPTLRALQLRHAVGSILADWRAWERGEREAPPAEPDAAAAGETVLVLRDPITQGYRSCVADAALLLAFKLAHDGLTPPVAAAAAGAASRAKGVAWKLDPVHSSVGFAVRHLGLSTVRGHLGDVAAEVRADEATGRITALSATAKTASIDTGNARRDAHLRSDDFFNAPAHPTLKLVLRRVSWKGKGFEALST